MHVLTAAPGPSISAILIGDHSVLGSLALFPRDLEPQGQLWRGVAEFGEVGEEILTF